MNTPVFGNMAKKSKKQSSTLYEEATDDFVLTKKNVKNFVNLHYMSQKDAIRRRKKH